MRRKLVWGMLAALAAATPALADDCKPLLYYTGVPITIEHGSLLVPVTLNQKPAMMMFDTGGIANQLSRGTVEALKLHELESRIELLDVSGNVSRTYVSLDDFSLGTLAVHRMQFQVSTIGSFDKENIAGLISNNFLRVFDVDLDFGSGRMNFFLPDHCPGNVVYWPVTTTTAAVPIQVDADTSHIMVPVTVDGHPMRATIDTGSSRTTMNLEDAKAIFGLVPDSPDTPAVNGHPNGDQSLNAYRHTFASLSFEGVTVKNPAINILPDRVNSKAQILAPGSHIASRDIHLPELLIGLDILQKLHVYISYRERMLYVTPSDDKAGKSLPALASTVAVQTPGTAPP